MDIKLLNGRALIDLSCPIFYICIATFGIINKLNMYKAFLLLLLAPVITFAQVKTAAVKAPVQPNAKGFVITGEISGLPKGAAVKLVNANTSTELASAVVQEKKASIKKNGKLVTTTTTYFKLTGSIEEPDLCVITIGNLRPFNLYTENSVITVTGTNTDMTKWVVKGSDSHQDFRVFETTFTPLAQQLNNVASTINNTAPG